MSYVKTHPLDYKPIMNRRSINLAEFTHKGEVLTRIQVVRMKNGQTRVINHYDDKPRRGRTLAEMVYDSVLNFNKRKASGK